MRSKPRVGILAVQISTFFDPTLKNAGIAVVFGVEKFDLINMKLKMALEEP